MVPQDRRTTMAKFFHGTTEENAAVIESCGFLRGPVFVSPSRDAAESYGDVVIEVFINENDLMIDLDMPGASLIDVETANGYLGNDWAISDYIENGYSVGVNSDVAV
jgi:hypothetical protein